MSTSRSQPKLSRVALAQQLFEQFYAECFWHMPPTFRVRAGDIPVIVKNLRTHGGRSGFFASASLCPSVRSKQTSSKSSRRTAA